MQILGQLAIVYLRCVLVLGGLLAIHVYICLLQLRTGHKLRYGPNEALMSFLDLTLCSGSTQADGLHPDLRT